MPQDQSRERRQGERQHVLEAANKGFSGQGHRSGGRHAQARKGKPDEEKEQGEVKQRPLPDDAIEAQRVQQPRNEQPREESNKKAQEQRRDEDACNIDLADHAAGLHAGLCLNRARRRTTRPRTSGLFSPEALRSSSDSAASVWASRVGEGESRPIHSHELQDGKEGGL